MREYRIVRTLKAFSPPITATHWSGTNEYELPARLREAEAAYSREPNVSHHVERREVTDWQPVTPEPRATGPLSRSPTGEGHNPKPSGGNQEGG